MPISNRDYILALVEKYEPQLRQAFQIAIDDIRRGADIHGIITALQRGDINAAVRAANIQEAAFNPLNRTIGLAFDAAGTEAIGTVPVARAADGLRLSILFNVRNLRAESWVSTRSSNLIRDIVEDQRTMARQVLTAGLERGANPRDTALDLVGRISQTTGKRAGGAIGLTSSQEAWAHAYVQELNDPATMAKALERKLRDKRFDAAVLKAIKEGKPIPAEKLQAMTNAYRNRALKYRADAIARTETLRAVHAGQDEAFRQAVENGTIKEQDVRRTWRSAHDKRVRDTHKALDGQTVGLNEPFLSTSGASLRYPCDEAAPAAETIQCRCMLTIKVIKFSNVGG